MNNNFLKNIKENIPKNGTVILAFSGGPDSVYLFYALKAAQKKHPFNIILAHFNHKIRGKDSDKDENFCRLFAKKHKTKIEVESTNILTKKGNLEETARKYRYEFLEKIRTKYKADLISTAHHLDDNIETFLMNFLRGAGLKGLTCMQIKSSKIFRPLLEVSKDEILFYLKKHSIKFCIDKTNLDSAYTRNNIRKNVIPVLKKIQPSLNEVFLRNWETLSLTQEFLDKQAEKWIKGNMKKQNSIPIKNFKSANPFMQKLIIMALFNIYHKTNDGLSKTMVQRVQKIINEKKSGKKTQFGPNTFIVINYNNFEIESSKKTKKINRKKLTIPGKTKYDYGEISAKILKKIPTNLSKGIYIDYLKCDPPLYLRSRKNGDKFRNIGMKGSQKLQDFFVNKKIQTNQRDLVPLIVDKNDEIVAIGKISVSDNHKVTKSTQKIISLSFKPSLENKWK